MSLFIVDSMLGLLLDDYCDLHLLKQRIVLEISYIIQTSRQYCKNNHIRIAEGQKNTAGVVRRYLSIDKTV